MTFAQIQGLDQLKTVLKGMVDTDHVPHAILFHEENGGGAFPLCLAFLQYLYCQQAQEDSCGGCSACNKINKLIHPDVHFVFPTAAGHLSLDYMAEFRSLVEDNPYFTEADLLAAMGIEGKNSIIAVSEAKHLLDVLSLSALEGGYRSVVIYLPEKMNQETANRLLKIVEEPPAKTQFLLITHSPEKVLSTISSRCQRIRVASSAQSFTGEYAKILTELMEALASRDLLSALNIADEIASDTNRERAKSFCKEASEGLRQIFLCQQGLLGLCDSSQDTHRWAPQFKKSFPRYGLDALSRAHKLIDRNVNLKILFTDLVNNLYMNI